MRVYLLRHHTTRAKLVVVLSADHWNAKANYHTLKIHNERSNEPIVHFLARFCPSRNETTVNIAK